MPDRPRIETELLARLPGGTVTALAAAEGPNGRELFAGTLAGVFRLGAESEGWARCSGPLAVNSLVLAPDYRDSGIVLAAAGDGIHRSADFGASWTFALATPPGATLLTLDRGLVLVGTEGDGMLRSEDAGLSWAPANAGLLDFDVLCLATAPGLVQVGVAFAGTASGIFQTPNGGKSWRALPGDFDVAVDALAVSPDFPTDGAILAGTECGLFITRDGGRNWHRETALPAAPVSAIGAGSGTWPPPIAVGEEIWVADVVGWRRAALTARPVFCLCRDQGGELIAGMVGAGLLRRRAGTDDWQTLNSNLHAVAVTHLAVGRQQITVGAADGTFWLSGDQGRSWEMLPALGYDTDELRLYDGSLLVLGAGRLVRLDRSARGFESVFAGSDELVATAIGGGDEDLIAATASGAILAPLLKGSPAVCPPCPGGRIRALAAAEPDGRRAILAVTDLPEGNGSVLWAWHGGGWTRCLDVEGVGSIHLAAVEDRGAVRAVLATDTRVFQARLESGPDWRVIDLGQATHRILALAARALMGEPTIVIATDAGLFCSMQHGEALVPMPVATGSRLAFSQLDFVPTDDATLIAATADGAIARLRIEAEP